MFRGILRRRALWILAGALAVSVLISGGAVRRYWLRRLELKRLEERRAEVMEKVREVEAQRARAEHDDAFIETAARRELGLVGSGEIEFRFVDPASTPTYKPNETDRSRP